jgi:hypothetical protein
LLLEASESDSGVGSGVGSGAGFLVFFAEALGFFEGVSAELSAALRFEEAGVFGVDVFGVDVFGVDVLGVVVLAASFFFVANKCSLKARAVLGGSNCLCSSSTRGQDVSFNAGKAAFGTQILLTYSRAGTARWD